MILIYQASSWKKLHRIIIINKNDPQYESDNYLWKNCQEYFVVEEKINNQWVGVGEFSLQTQILAQLTACKIFGFKSVDSLLKILKREFKFNVTKELQDVLISYKIMYELTNLDS